MNGRIYAIGGSSSSETLQGTSVVLEYTPPIMPPALKINWAQNSGQNVLRLEWPSYPDYIDVLQSRNQLGANEWTYVERFSESGGTLTKEIPTVQPAAFFRLQRALR